MTTCTPLNTFPIFLVLAALLSTNLQAETKVIVTDADNGRPVKKALVAIFSTDDPPSTLDEGHTDANGEYVVDDIDAKHSRVTITAQAGKKHDDKDVARDENGWPAKVELQVRARDLRPVYGTQYRTTTVYRQRWSAQTDRCGRVYYRCFWVPERVQVAETTGGWWNCCVPCR